MTWTTPRLWKSASGSKSTATYRPSSDPYVQIWLGPLGHRRAAFIFALRTYD